MIGGRSIFLSTSSSQGRLLLVDKLNRNPLRRNPVPSRNFLKYVDLGTRFRLRPILECNILHRRYCHVHSNCTKDKTRSTKVDRPTPSLPISFP